MHVVGSRGLLRHLVHDLIYIKINKMVAFSLYPLCILLGYVESHVPFLPNHQMVNTRNSQCNGQPSNNNNNNSNNNVNLEQLITTQNQLMQVVLQTLNNVQPNQQAHQQQAPPPPPQHQSRLVEFLRTRPTTFSVTPTFCKNKNFCANRSAYKNAYQIIVLLKNFPKINLA
jgi:TolA-binding protein